MAFSTLLNSFRIYAFRRVGLHQRVRRISQKGRACRQAGFTLIELLAVCFVIVIISTLILVSNSAFGGAVLLENLAYDMAISIRQAQVYGISVQRFGDTSFNTFGAGYGMHFAKSSPSDYVLFGDAITPNGYYDCQTAGSPQTCEAFTATHIERGYLITKLCAPAQTNTATCLSNSVTGLDTLDILFKRPEPDAYITGNSLSCPLGSGTCYSSARIVVMSPRGDLSSVVVSANGQISVEK